MKHSSNTPFSQNEILYPQTEMHDLREEIPTHIENFREAEEQMLHYFIENGMILMAKNYEKFLQSKYWFEVNYNNEILKKFETINLVWDLYLDWFWEKSKSIKENIWEEIFVDDNFLEFLCNECDEWNIKPEQKWMILYSLWVKWVQFENTDTFQIEKLYLQYPRIDYAFMQEMYEILKSILENTHIWETDFNTLVESYWLQDLRNLDLPSFQELDDLFKKTQYFHGSGRYKYSWDKTLQTIDFSQVDDILNWLEKRWFIPHTDALNFWNTPSISFTKSRMYAKVYSKKFHSEELQYEFFDRSFWLGWFLYDFYMPAMEKISMIRNAFGLQKYSQPKVFQNWFDDIHSSIWKTPVTGEKIMEIKTDIPSNYWIVYWFNIDFEAVGCEFDPLRFHESRCAEKVDFTPENITYIEVPLRHFWEVKAYFEPKWILVLPTEYIELYATQQWTILREFFPKW